MRDFKDYELVFHREDGHNIRIDDSVPNLALFMCTGCDTLWNTDLPESGSEQYIGDQFVYVADLERKPVFKLYLDPQLGCTMCRPATPEEVKRYYGDE